MSHETSSGFFITLSVFITNLLGCYGLRGCFCPPRREEWMLGVRVPLSNGLPQTQF